MTISMRDFINGPYIKCPKCGRNSFGILSIHHHRYSRRCRECFYPHPSRGEDSVIISLAELNKKKGAKIMSEYHDGKVIWIDVNKKTATTSRIQIRVGVTGDEMAANEIMDEILKHL